MRARHFPCAALLVAAAVVPAGAQAIDPATRPLGGLFAERRGPDTGAPEMTLWLDLGGGYDENLEPEATPGVPVQVFNPQQSGYVGTGTGTLRYRQGTTTRYFEGQGRAYLSHASAGAQRIAGGSAGFEAAGPISPRNGFTANLTAAYDPTFLFNAFGPVTESVEGGVIPGSAPARGITEQQWVSGQGHLGLYRNWTPRQRTNVQYAGQRRKPVSGPGFENVINAATVRHTWNVREHASLQFTYDLSHNLQRDELGAEQPLRSQGGELALTLARPLSPDRRLSVTFGGGVRQARLELPGTLAQFEVPIASGSARLDLRRNWSVSLDGRRDVTVLNGLSPEPFVTDMLSARSLALFAERLQLSVTGSVSRGASRLTETGEFRNLIATLQLHYALSRWCAVFTNVSHYSYRLLDLELVQPGFPSRYDLNSVRLGFSFWLPLYGRF